MAERLIGHVTHWYSHLGVAGIHIDDGELSVGDRIHILGHTSDFEEVVSSIEIDHRHVDAAHEGDDVGLRVADHARDHDLVYKVVN